MATFKVGDRVKCIKDFPDASPDVNPRGKVGVIVAINNRVAFPYHVVMSHFPDHTFFFVASEITHAPEGERR